MAPVAGKSDATPPAANLGQLPVECDAYIEQKIQKTRQHLHAIELTVTLMVLAVGSLAYLALMVLVDHWVMPHGLGFGLRLAALLLFLIGAGSYGAMFVAPLLVRRVNPLYAARAIEQSRPALKNSLINLLLLRSRAGELPPVVFEGMRHQAANDLTTVTVESAVDGSRLVKLGYVLAALVVAFCLYKVVSPKDPLRSIGRVIDPWADLAVPTRVQIEDVQPGDSHQLQEKRVRVSALVDGLEAGEPVTIYYSTADGQLVDQPIRMELPDDSYRYTADLPEGGAGLQQDLTYRITAGDAISRTFQVQAMTAPAISVERVDYEYPAYTELPPRTTERQGDLQAIEGTEVTLHAKATHPIRAAHVRFDEGGSSGIPMSAKGREASAKIELKLADGKSEHSNYYLVFSDLQGHGPDDITPVRYRIEVVADLPPEVAFVEPHLDSQQEISLAETGSLRLALAAADPDFKLAKLTLMFERNGSKFPRQPLLAEPRGGPVRASYLLNARSLGLKPGDKLEFWAVAEDNKQPAANVVETARYTLKIVSPGEQKKPQDQLAQAKPPEAGGPKEPPPPDGQKGEPPPDAGKRPQNQPPENGDKNEQQQQPGAKGQQPDDGKQGDRQQQDQQPGVDPDADPGKAIEKINEHFNQNQDGQNQPPQNNGEKQEGRDQGEPPEPKKSNNPNQEESPAGKGEKSSARSQKPGESGKGQSPDQGQSGEQGQAGEGGTGRARGDQPENTPPGSDQKPDQPSELGGEEDKGLGGQRAGQNSAADPNAGGKPGQSGDQAGEKSGEKSGGQPGSDQNPAGAGQNAGANEQPAGGQKQSAGQQQGGQQPDKGEKSGQGNQPAGGQQSQAGEKLDGAKQPGQQGAGGQKPEGQQSPGGEKQAGQQAADQQNRGQQNAGQQGNGGQQGEKQQSAGQSGDKQSGDKQLGDKQLGDKQAGDKQAGEKQAGGADQAGNPADGAQQSGEQGGKQPGENSPEGKPGEAAKPAEGQQSGQAAQAGQGEQGKKNEPGQGDKPGQGEKAAGQAGEEAADDKPANQQAAGQPDTKGSNPESGKEQSGAGQQSGEKQGTPSPQESNQSHDKQDGQSGEQQQPMNSGEGSSPSRSPKESNSKGSTGGDQSGGGTDGGGQKANQPGTGGAGQNTASDEGGGKANEGTGETSGAGGDQAQAQKPTPGKSGSQPGEGSGQQAGGSKPGGQEPGKQQAGKQQVGKQQAGNQQSGNQKPGNQQQPNQAAGDQQQPNDSSAGDNNGATAQGGGKQQGSSNPGGGGAANQNNGARAPQQASTAGPEEDPNLDYARKATDLALERLKHQLQQPGADELLDKLKWTRDDARRFIERWETMKHAAQQPGEAGRTAQAQLDDTLRSLGLRPHGTTASGDRYQNQRLRNLRDTSRTRPPAEYADQYRAYSTGTSQARGAEQQK